VKHRCGYRPSKTILPSPSRTSSAIIPSHMQAVHRTPIHLRIIPSILALIALIPSLLAAEPLSGVWNTGEDNTYIKTFQKDGAWFGKIVSSDNSEAKVGSDILLGFAEANGVWTGKMFLPRRDKTVDATIQATAGELIINVSTGLMGRTLTWTRVSGGD